jgi:hypothetical protein
MSIGRTRTLSTGKGHTKPVRDPGTELSGMFILDQFCEAVYGFQRGPIGRWKVDRIEEKEHTMELKREGPPLVLIGLV